METEADAEIDEAWLAEVTEAEQAAYCGKRRRMPRRRRRWRSRAATAAARVATRGMILKCT